MLVSRSGRIRSPGEIGNRGSRVLRPYRTRSSYDDNLRLKRVCDEVQIYFRNIFDDTRRFSVEMHVV